MHGVRMAEAQEGMNGMLAEAQQEHSGLHYRGAAQTREQRAGGQANLTHH